MSDVGGSVDPRFAAVRDEFAAQLAKGEHVGASVAVYHRGAKVADLWGGVMDRESNAPWRDDTMVICMSVTKGLAAACVHLLAERRALSYDDPVAKFWPEFAQQGKERISVRQVLSHQSGMALVPDGIASGDLVDWERMTGALAAAPPAWEPGTATGYHALTFGWLTGEIVRRIDGRSVGTFFRDEIAGALDLRDIHIGLPPSAEPRVAKLISLMPDTPETRKARDQLVPPESMTRRASAPRDERMLEVLDSPQGHQAEMPAVNGIMTARDLARFYAMFANYGELDGARLLSEARVRELSAQVTLRRDKVLIIPIGWALGYMTGGLPGWSQGPRVTSFGHPGFGGSVGFADPEIGLAFACTLNGLDADFFGTGRASRLAAAARACAEAAERG